MAVSMPPRKDAPDLVYRLEDKPPFANALLSAVTHLLAIFVPMITPALIVGGALKLPHEMTAYLVSMAIRYLLQIFGSAQSNYRPQRRKNYCCEKSLQRSKHRQVHI